MEKTLEDFTAEMVAETRVRKGGPKCRVCYAIEKHPVIADIVQHGIAAGHSYGVITKVIVDNFDVVLHQNGTNVKSHVISNHG